MLATTIAILGIFLFIYGIPWDSVNDTALVFGSRIPRSEKNNFKIKKVYRNYYIILGTMGLVPIIGTLFFIMNVEQVNINVLNMITVILLLVLLLSTFKLFKEIRKIKKEDSIVVENDDDKFWIYGVLYNNPDDKKIFVPERYSLTGITINLGNKNGKIALILIIVVIVIIGIFFDNKI